MKVRQNKHKKIILICMVALSIYVLSSCTSKTEFEDTDLSVGEIKVTSSSITVEGKLVTSVASDKGTNKPAGKNESPQVSWESVEGASFYAVCMFDEDANWLHWFRTDISADTTSLIQGEDTSKKVYVGPYPPKSGGSHKYRIEVFAIKQQPNDTIGKLNAVNSYKGLVNHLNQVGNNSDNIIARGYITGSYQNGDNTINP